MDLVFTGSTGVTVTVRAGHGVRALVDALIATSSAKTELEAELTRRSEHGDRQVESLRAENARLEDECARLRERRKKTVVRDAKGQIQQVIESPA